MEETGSWELRNNCLLPLLPFVWIVFVKCFTEWISLRFLDLTLCKVFYPSSIYKAILKFFWCMIFDHGLTCFWYTGGAITPCKNSERITLLSLNRAETDVKSGDRWLWVANIQVQTKWLSTGSVYLFFSHCLSASHSEKDLIIQRMELLTLPWSCCLNL